MRPYYKPRHTSTPTDKKGSPWIPSKLSPNVWESDSIFHGTFYYSTAINPNTNQGLSYDPYKGEK